MRPHHSPRSRALLPRGQRTPRPRQEMDGQGGEEQTSLDLSDDAWARIDDASKPWVDVIPPEVLEEERRQAEMWKMYEESGEAPHPALVG